VNITRVEKISRDEILVERIYVFTMQYTPCCIDVELSVVFDVLSSKIIASHDSFNEGQEVDKRPENEEKNGIKTSVQK
jgi:hypothetical protein